MGRQYNTIYWRWLDNTIQYIEDGQTMQYNILKMVCQYNTISLRLSDNTIQYIKDGQTIQ
jgi:hypothetical protein